MPVLSRSRYTHFGLRDCLALSRGASVLSNNAIQDSIEKNCEIGKPSKNKVKIS